MYQLGSASSVSGDVNLVPFLVADFLKNFEKLIQDINFMGVFVRQFLSPPEN